MHLSLIPVVCWPVPFMEHWNCTVALYYLLGTWPWPQLPAGPCHSWSTRIAQLLCITSWALDLDPSYPQTYVIHRALQLLWTPSWALHTDGMVPIRAETVTTQQEQHTLMDQREVFLSEFNPRLYLEWHYSTVVGKTKNYGIVFGADELFNIFKQGNMFLILIKP